MEALTIIRTIMKEFCEVPDEEVEFYLSLAEPLISKRRFGKLYPQTLAYLSAHKMKLAGLGESVGSTSGTIGSTIGLSSVSEGGTSVSFSNNQIGNTTVDAEYGLTVYGLQFLQIRRNCIIPIISAGGRCGE